MTGRTGRRTPEKRAADRAAGIDRNGRPLPRAGTEWPGPCLKPPPTERNYFRSRRWQFIEGFARKAGICSTCRRSEPKLRVRLLRPDRIGREQPADVLALCRSCDARYVEYGPRSFEQRYMRARG